MSLWASAFLDWFPWATRCEFMAWQFLPTMPFRRTGPRFAAVSLPPRTPGDKSVRCSPVGGLWETLGICGLYLCCCCAVVKSVCLEDVTNLRLSFSSLLSSFLATSIHSDCHSACQQCSWHYREWRYLLFSSVAFLWATTFLGNTASLLLWKRDDFILFFSSIVVQYYICFRCTT